MARRAIAVGTLPLAMTLAVACSSSNDQPAKVAGGTTQSAAPQASPTRQPGNATAPEGNPQPGTGSADSGIGAGAGTGAVADSPFPGQRPSAIQPGVAAPAGDRPGARTVQPGITAPNQPQAQPQPQSDYPIPANFRPVPNNREAAPALDFQTLHAPSPVAPVAPIAPPPRTLRVGAFSTPVGDDVPDTVLDPVNTGAANIEAGIATGLNSVGINASRSDKIAGLTVAGAVGGAVAGATIAGAPAAILGAAVGAPIGLAVGTGVGAVIGGIAMGIPSGGTASGVGAAAGAAIGAGVGVLAGGAIGAAVVGVPAAVVGGAIGGALGGAAGTAFGAAV